MKTAVHGTDLLNLVKSALEASVSQEGAVVVRFDLKDGELSGSMTVVDDAVSDSTTDEFDISL